MGSEQIASVEKGHSEQGFTEMSFVEVQVTNQDDASAPDYVQQLMLLWKM